jgi:restriction system protein
MIDYLGGVFKLSKEERNRLLPSGTQLLFNNRVQWARLYLDKAGLIDTPERATYRITPRGLKVLQEEPGRIDRVYLMKFSEFKEFIGRTKAIEEDLNKKSQNIKEETHTPQEIIEEAYQTIKLDLVQQILDNLNSSRPSFFEAVVIDLLLAMGYGGSKSDAAEIRGKSGDEGIDGVIKEDKLGLDVVYVQAKRWNNTVVGRPEIQKFVGALKGQRARKGIFITTSKFLKEAEDYARDCCRSRLHGVHLIS